MSAQPPPKIPFVGPQAFKVTDDWRFFGRDREAADLIDIVAASRIVLLYSPSGAGKSSLINAAVIPQFPKRFRVLPVISVGGVPSPSPDGVTRNRYLESAVRSIEHALPEAERLPASALAGMRFDSYLARRRELAGDDHPELLIFDQFEEILAIDAFDLDAKTAFFEEVGEALRDRQRWAIFSMREEYDAQLDPYRRLVPTGLSTRFRLDLLTTDAAMEAVWRPTLDLPVKITEGAAKKVVADLSQIRIEQDGKVVTRQGQYVDPVQLQVVCLRLWQKRPPDATEITADSIDRTGTNVDIALAEYYANTVAGAAEETGIPERAIRAWIGEHLITRHGNRNRVLREPGESRGLADRTIALLIDRYLLRTVPGDATWIELAHDRLVQPVRENNEAWFRDNLSLLQRHAEAWDKGGRTQELLLPAGLLKEARTWAAENSELVTPTERQFLARSDEARAHLLWRRVVPAAAVLILILAALAGWALLEREQKNDEAVAASEARATADVARATAESQAEVSRVRALAAQAPDQHDTGDDERGALLALEAYQLDVEDGGRSRDLVDESLRTVLSHPQFSVELSHEDAIIAAAFSDDGSALTTVTGPLNVTGGRGDRAITVWRWDTREAGFESYQIDWAGTALTSVVIDPVGTKLAVGTRDGAIRVWDLARAGDEPVTLRDSGPPVGALAFSGDSARLAAGHADGEVQIWMVNQRGGEPDTLPIGTGAITGLVFSPGGTILAVGRENGQVDLWDTDGGGVVPLSLPRQGGAVRTLAFNPDGTLLATAGSDAMARLWEIPSGEAHGDPIASGDVLAFSPDGAMLAVARVDHTVVLVDLSNSNADPVTLVGHGDAVRAIAFDPDGASLVTGSADGTARLWDLVAPAAGPAVVAEGGSGESENVAGALTFYADGTLGFATLDRDGALRQWRLINSELQVSEVSGSGGGGVTALSLGADGSMLAAGGRDGSVRLWIEGTAAPGQVVQRSSRRVVTALAFSPDGSVIAIGGADGTIRLWSLTGEGSDAVRQDSGVVSALAFSHDGERLASGRDDGSVVIWDLTNADQHPRRLQASGSAVASLAFAPNDTTLATGGTDGTVRLWSVTTPNAPPVVLRGPSGPVTAMIFSSDGAILFTAHADGSIRAWVARTDVLAGMVCQKVRRNLTQAEWNQFVGEQVSYQRTCENLPPGEGAPGAGTPVAPPVSLRRVAGAG